MKTFFLSSLLLIVSYSWAQNTNPKGEFHYGLHAGLNLANLTNDDEADTRVGANIGIFVAFDIENSPFQLRSGINYSQQGATANTFVEVDPMVDPGGGLNVDAIVKLDYLQIPLVVQYDFTPVFSIYLGPQVGFVVTDEVEVDLGDLGEVSQEIQNEQGTTLSAIVGFQAFIHQGLFARAQYDLGLTKVYRDTNFPGFGTFENDIKHSVFTLAVGYQF